MSCWTELDERARKELVTALEKALTVPDSPELSLAVLNLAEFMEHCEKGVLPITIKLLGDTAINCRAYAKALYYKVILFNGVSKFSRASIICCVYNLINF
jgi:serine/threonine-protein kinase mTOR